MSKNVAVFVDVANLYYSARGLEVDVDYVALLKAATKGRDLIRAYAYSGLDPENENQRKFIDFLGKNGYKVVHKDIRKFGDGRVKANLDIELVVDLFRLADRMDIAVIVSGDGDFAPAIRALQDKGVRCEVISFRPNTSSDLIAVADEFIDIMKIIGIGRGKDADKASKVMSAPPMPAKEVVPEFGFREAPPAVAAAALAAIREGKAPPGAGRAAWPRSLARCDRRRRGGAGSRQRAGRIRRGRSRRERRGPPSPTPTRRPRSWPRPSRRGRGERAGDQPARSAGPSWTTSRSLKSSSAPLTDEADEEREYTFEEADAATLAELGLLDGETPAAPAAEDKTAEAKPARRSRTLEAHGWPRTSQSRPRLHRPPRPDRARRRSPLLMGNDERGSPAKPGGSATRRQGGGHDDG